MFTFRNKGETVLLDLETASAFPKDKGMHILKSLQMNFATTINN